MLRGYLEQVPEVSFRVIPDEAGDSCTFLSWFLPSEEVTKGVVEELKAQGIMAGNFYWYINNWHYISKWDHLKNAVSLNSLPDAVTKSLKSNLDKSFAASDAVMSRCISTAIGLGWTEEQIREKGSKMVAVIKKVLQRQPVTA